MKVLHIHYKMCYLYYFSWDFYLDEPRPIYPKYPLVSKLSQLTVDCYE